MSHRRATAGRPYIRPALPVLGILLTVVVLLASTGIAFADATWTNKNPSSHPSAREQFGMAFLGGDQALLYGGVDSSGSGLADTWVYDLSANAWTNKAPATNPTTQFARPMSHINDNLVLLFGKNTSGSSGETWVYDLSNNSWSKKDPPVAPLARTSAAMAPLGGGKVLLFGGFTGSSAGPYAGDTWVYDYGSNTWSQKMPLSSPSPRNSHAMAYLGGDQVLLFGGQGPEYVQYGDTWIYDLSEDNWTLQQPAAAPSARNQHAMADLGGDEAILFGGYTDNGASSETWVYDLSLNTWVQQFPALSPSARWSHCMAYAGTGKAVLFGGINAADYTDMADTWSVTQPAIPDGVTNVGIGVYSATEAKVTWNASANATGYEVWYAANQPYFTLASGATCAAPPEGYGCASRTATDFTHSAFGDVSKNYTYRVAAVTASARSPLSSPAVAAFGFGLTAGSE